MRSVGESGMRVWCGCYDMVVLEGFFIGKLNRDYDAGFLHEDS